MSAFFATAADTATLAALGRFHTSTKDSQTIHHPTGRQRSSSFTDRGTNVSLLPPSTAPLSASKKLAMNNDTLNKGLHQHENTVAPRDLPARPLSLSYSGPSIAESTSLPKTLSMFTSRAHQEDLDRKKYPSAQDPHSHQASPRPSSPKDENSDIPAEQTPTICTGRSRSNTLTTSSSDAVDVAEASISDQIDHVMRPRRPSLAIRPSGFIVSPDADLASDNATVQRTPIHSYPPLPLVPQYQAMEENKGGVDSTAPVSISPSTSPSSLPWINLQLGFLPRITVLIGLFGLSLGGLFLLAKVLPPLSLPKSIDDVKVDAAILQEFATATFEGWIRTFWVFSAVYIWKQCFGIPGSAFLVRMM
ncbi:MAG: hypothetical protein J3Q66DRAFT_206450 [Benniella sp.]|nr:MAG: hypothetical protein J3Q66DRAFT_206450 [Benniella sp.]